MKRADIAAQLRLSSDLKMPVLTLARYLEQLARKTPFAESSPVKTFDDGFVTKHEAAYPLLQEHGFSASSFVCLLNIESGSRRPQSRQMYAVRRALYHAAVTKSYSVKWQKQT